MKPRVPVSQCHVNSGHCAQRLEKWEWHLCVCEALLSSERRQDGFVTSHTGSKAAGVTKLLQ